MMKKRVFISGALTGIQKPQSVKAYYERLAQACEDLGWDPYVPHKHSDPIAHPHLSAREVYGIDRYQVRTSNLVIAYAGIPSLGTGQEVQIAEEHGVPVVLLFERGKLVSRMTRGSPNVIAEICFDDIEDCLSQVGTVLADEMQVMCSPQAVPAP